jgi:integrase
MDKAEPKKRITNAYAEASDKESPLQKTYPKTDVRYWRERVYKPVTARGGANIESEHFAVQIQHRGPRKTLSLKTANREEAAQKARRMYLDLVAGGWDLLFQKHRPKPPESLEKKETSLFGEKDPITFGQYVALIRSKNLIAARTLDGYVPRLRRIIAEIKGIKSSPKRFAAKKGKTWRDQVDAVAMSAITPDDVRQWKRRCIDKAKSNELLRRQHTISVNSTLRQAKGLFGERKILRHLPEIPRPHLFEGVEYEPRVDMKFYGVGIDAPTLLRRAIAELSQERREECKAFLLAIAIGLRRKEADHLMWQSFDFVAGTVQVQPTEHYALKTPESAATLVLDAEIMALFKGWHAQRTGNFVIESDRPPRDVGYHYYRADQVFDSLVKWLREQGITVDKPFHSLRKIFGSLIVERHGIFAASSALRHTSIELTNAYYVDRTVRTTSGLGSVLSGAVVLNLPELPVPPMKAPRSAP